METDRTIIPLMALVFLAPLIGEGISTSTPVHKFFQPVTLLLLIALYGFGALQIRESMVRWGKQGNAWRFLLIMGAAYGIVEEALYLLSFFNPQWVDLGPMTNYGRWLGVNWPWAFELTIFHAIYSITIPILVVHTIFPSLRDRPWLSEKGDFTCLAVFLVSGPLWLLFVTDKYGYITGAAQYGGFLLLVLVLIAIARRGIGEDNGTRQTSSRPRPAFLFMSGLIWAILFFLIFAWLVPTWEQPPIFSMTGLFGITLLWVVPVDRWLTGNPFRDHITMTSAGLGALSFLIIFLLLVGEPLSKIIFGILGVAIILVTLLKIGKKRDLPE